MLFYYKLIDVGGDKGGGVDDTCPRALFSHLLFQKNYWWW